MPFMSTARNLSSMNKKSFNTLNNAIRQQGIKVTASTNNLGSSLVDLRNNLRITATSHSYFKTQERIASAKQNMRSTKLTDSYENFHAYGGNELQIHVKKALESTKKRMEPSDSRDLNQELNKKPPVIKYFASGSVPGN